MFAAAQLFLENVSARHACRAVVLASEEGLPVAGTGSEEDVTEVAAVATHADRAAEHGVQCFSVVHGDDRFFVGALGVIPELECRTAIARILATAEF